VTGPWYLLSERENYANTKNIMIPMEKQWLQTKHPETIDTGYFITIDSAGADKPPLK